MRQNLATKTVALEYLVARKVSEVVRREKQPIDALPYKRGGFGVFLPSLLSSALARCEN
jgi:hypothetical protein